MNEQNISKAKIALQNTELKQASFLRIMLSAGIILAGLFLLFFYNRYKLTQKQNLLIEQQQKITTTQKTEIENKNNLITQSIDYAKNIQDALIQGENIIQELNKDYFIFNQPKDIVSGDFLWAKKIKDTIVFAVVDCTGHGVPGAFMSLLGYTMLEQTSLSKPAEILESLYKNIQESFHHFFDPDNHR